MEPKVKRPRGRPKGSRARRGDPTKTSTPATARRLLSEVAQAEAAPPVSSQSLISELDDYRINRGVARKLAARYIPKCIKGLGAIIESDTRTVDGRRQLRHAAARVHAIERMLDEARGKVPDERNVPPPAVGPGAVFAGDVQILQVLNLSPELQEQYAATGQLPPSAWSAAARAAEQALIKQTAAEQTARGKANKPNNGNNGNGSNGGGPPGDQ